MNEANAPEDPICTAMSGSGHSPNTSNEVETHNCPSGSLYLILGKCQELKHQRINSFYLSSPVPYHHHLFFPYPPNPSGKACLSPIRPHQYFIKVVPGRVLTQCSCFSQTPRSTLRMSGGSVHPRSLPVGGEVSCPSRSWHAGLGPLTPGHDWSPSPTDAPTGGQPTCCLSLPRPAILIGAFFGTTGSHVHGTLYA